MKLFVFLGNIGLEYEKTRHNAGFLFGEYLRQEWKFSEWQEMPKFFGFISTGTKNGEKFIFLKPTTFMNRSGKAIIAVKNFYKLENADITLFFDDKDMEFGKLRFRAEGSSGGHRGVEDVLRALGTNEILRWKIGVDTPERLKFADTADFVLAKFSATEIERLSSIFVDLAQQVGEKAFDSAD